MGLRIGIDTFICPACHLHFARNAHDYKVCSTIRHFAQTPEPFIVSQARMDELTSLGMGDVVGELLANRRKLASIEQEARRQEEDPRCVAETPGERFLKAQLSRLWHRAKEQP